MKKLLRLGILCTLLVAALCVGALAADSPPDGQYTYFTVTSGTYVTVKGKDNTAFSATVTGAGNGAECLLLVTTTNALPTAENLIYVNQATADASGKVTFENVVPKDMNKDCTYYVYATSATKTYASQTPATFGYYYSEIFLGDVDGVDGITTTDALWALQNYLETRPLDATQKAAADVDGVDGITTTDALWILQRYLETRDANWVLK